MANQKAYLLFIKNTISTWACFAQRPWVSIQSKVKENKSILDSQRTSIFLSNLKMVQCNLKWHNLKIMWEEKNSVRVYNHSVMYLVVSSSPRPYPRWVAISLWAPKRDLSTSPASLQVVLSSIYSFRNTLSTYYLPCTRS